MYNVYSQFIETFGSSIWPSDDPNDSPFNTFTCKHCGKAFKLKCFGACKLGDKSFYYRNSDVLSNHIKKCQQFKKGA